MQIYNDCLQTSSLFVLRFVLIKCHVNFFGGTLVLFIMVILCFCLLSFRAHRKLCLALRGSYYAIPAYGVVCSMLHKQTKAVVFSVNDHRHQESKNKKGAIKNGKKTIISILDAY